MATPIPNLFDGFGLTNALSLLHLRMGICWRLSPGVRGWPKGYLDSEKTIVLRIVELMEKSPLLKKIFEFLMGIPTYDGPRLLQVANQVRFYATVEAQDPSLPAYQSAVRAWKMRQVIPEYDLSSDDSDTGSIIVERPILSTSTAAKKTEKLRKSAKVQRSKGGASNDSLRRSSRRVSNIHQEAEESDADLQSGGEENDENMDSPYEDQSVGSARSIKAAGRAKIVEKRLMKKTKIIIKAKEDGREEQEKLDTSSETPANPRSKHAPKLKRGYIGIDDDSIDTSNAVLGEKDMSKLLIEFETQMEAPPHIHGGSVTYHYANKDKPYSIIDWNDRKAISLINKWRTQVFGRGKIGSRRDTRAIWLDIEKELVLRLAGEQFKLRPFVKWNRLGNEFNHGQRGTMHPAKSNFLKKGNAKNPWLKDKREPPWRTSLAIQTKAHEWDEFWEMEEAARNMDRSDDDEGLDSGDDAEDPEPNNHPDNNTIAAPIMTKIFSGEKRSTKPKAKTTPKVRPSNPRKRKSRLLEAEDSDSDSWILTDKMKQKRQKFGRKNLSEIFRPRRSDVKVEVASSDSGVIPAASKQQPQEPTLSQPSGMMGRELQSAPASEKNQNMGNSNGYSDVDS